MQRRTAALAAIGAGALLAIAAPLSANAHVTVTPDQAEPGGYTVITVKVPNESVSAATVRVELTIPAETPFASVTYVPVPGWTAELVKTTFDEPVVSDRGEITEAVTKVIWTAEPGSELVDGQLQLFPLSVGPVPDTGSIVLKADQVYSDGEVVSWSEEGEDAQHPAPVLYVNDAPQGHSHEADSTEDADETAGADHEAVTASEAAAGGDALARGFGIGGLVVGIVGVVIAGLSWRRAAKAQDATRAQS